MRRVTALLAAFLLLGLIVWATRDGGGRRHADPVTRPPEAGATDPLRPESVSLEGRPGTGPDGPPGEMNTAAGTTAAGKTSEGDAEKQAPRRALEIQVLDRERKAPLAKARLRLFPPETPPHGKPTQVVLTDAEGRGRLEVADGTAWYVEALAEGYEPQRVVLMRWGRGTLRSTLKLRRAGRVRGRVVREDGGPQEALVWVVYAGGDPLRDYVQYHHGPGPVPTAEDGSFEIPGVALHVSFSVKGEAADGAVGATPILRLTQDAPEQSGLRLAVAPRGTLRFRLLTPDGRPYLGGRLYLRPLAVHGDETDLDERSPDAGGRVLYEGLPAGRYRVAFHHDDLRWQPVTEGPIAVRPGETTDLGDLRLGTGRSVKGRVVIEDGNGEDLQALRLKLFDATRTFWTHTQEGGVFVFHDVEEGRFHLEIDSEAYRLSKPCIVDAGADGLALAAVGPSAGLHFTVVDADGEAVSHFQTYVIDHGPPGSPSRQQYSGEKGRLGIDGLPPGAYDVMVEAEGMRLWRREAVDLLRGEAKRLEVVLRPAEPIRRKVLGPDGKPRANASAELTYVADVPFGRRHESSVDMQYDTAFADAEGVITLLPGRPDLAVAIQAPGCAPVRYELAELPEGPIRLGKGVVVTGRVLTRAGEASGRVHLAFDPAGRYTPFGRTTWTDAEGRFRVEDVGPGVWTVRAYSLRGDVILEQDVAFEAPTTDVGTIRLP